MAALAKIILALLAAILGNSPRRSNARSSGVSGKELVAALDFFFCLALTTFLAIQLGAFKFKTFNSGGSATQADLLIFLFYLAIKGVGFILLPSILLTILLRALPGVGLRIFIYSVFAVIAAAGYHFAQQRSKADLAAAQAVAAAKVRAAQADANAASSMKDARATAAQREIQRRLEYAQQLRMLSADAERRWRANVRSGADGEVPPMLAVRDLGHEQWQLTNLTGKRVCVKVARVLRTPGTDRYQRCEFDQKQECSILAPGRTATRELIGAETSDPCGRGILEYRVGTPLQPESSWWSISALQDYDENPPDLNPWIDKLSMQSLRDEIARVEKILAIQGLPAQQPVSPER